MRLPNKTLKKSIKSERKKKRARKQEGENEDKSTFLDLKTVKWLQRPER